MSEGGGGGDRAVRAWPGRTRDGRARWRRRGTHERTISRRSFLAQNDSPRRGSRNASPRGGTPDPRRIDRGIGSRSTGGGQATGNAPQPTSHQRPSAFEGIAHRIPRRRSRRAGKRRRATPREVHSDQTKRAVPTRDRRERLAVSHKLKIGKNVETRVSALSRASARVLSLSTQTAAPCTYFHRLKHSKQCDPRRSSRCYSRGDGRRTRTRRTSTTLCSHSIYLRDKHRRRDGDDQGHHRASAVRRVGTPSSSVVSTAPAPTPEPGGPGGPEGPGAPGPGGPGGPRSAGGAEGLGGLWVPGSGRSRSGRTCRGRGGRGRRRETHLARKKECGGDGASPTSPSRVTPQHHVDSPLRTAHV